MIVSFFLLYWFALCYWLEANSFVFEDEGKRYHTSMQQDSSLSPRRGLGSHFNPTTIGNILNIPTTLIQTTSVAAQSFAPNNADMINKVFDIPVQTLQAIGNFVKDVTPPSVDNQVFMNRREERQQRLMKIRQQQQQQHLQLLQDQQQQNEDHTTRRRHVLGGFGLAPTFSDLFFGGHGSLFGRDQYFFGGQGGRQGQRKRKKKNKHGIFGGNGTGDNGGNQPIFNNDKDIYQVYNDIHDILPNGLFTWNHMRKFDRIQNKIAPDFGDRQ